MPHTQAAGHWWKNSTLRKNTFVAFIGKRGACMATRLAVASNAAQKLRYGWLLVDGENVAAAVHGHGSLSHSHKCKEMIFENMLEMFTKLRGERNYERMAVERITLVWHALSSF
eukprot:1512707-Amphidinium_carterae.1